MQWKISELHLADSGPFRRRVPYVWETVRLRRPSETLDASLPRQQHACILDHFDHYLFIFRAKPTRTECDEKVGMKRDRANSCSLRLKLAASSLQIAWAAPRARGTRRASRKANCFFAVTTRLWAWVLARRTPTRTDTEAKSALNQPPAWCDNFASWESIHCRLGVVFDAAKEFLDSGTAPRFQR